LESEIEKRNQFNKGQKKIKRIKIKLKKITYNKLELNDKSKKNQIFTEVSKIKIKNKKGLKFTSQ
jgi:U3 small nucleolar ribonucleoprotein component